ncbi:MAG: hypothetical protein HQM02_06620 [Magnetococcales bacterium]|nr:hypothetical protein [Magnetococcales bacterium]
MRVTHKIVCLSLMLLVAPLSIAWGAGSGQENPQIAKTATKVTLPVVAKESRQTAQIRKQIEKDREALRKQVLAKKMQKKGLAKKSAKKSVRKASRNKPALQARNTTRIPSRIGIRTWTFPESAGTRTNKVTELTARITETENAYDAENAQFQRLNREYNRLKAEMSQAEKAMQVSMEPQNQALENYKKAQELARSNPQISIEPQRLAYLKAVEKTAAVTAAAGRNMTASSSRLAPLEAKLTASQVRLNDIMNQLDALQQHRNAVSEVVFLRTVKD